MDTISVTLSSSRQAKIMKQSIILLHLIRTILIIEALPKINVFWKSLVEKYRQEKGESAISRIYI